MVPAWMGLAAWLAAWTALAWFSMRLLAKARPGERIPLIIKADGTAKWMLSPVVAAGLVPAFSVVAGVVINGAGFMFRAGRVSLMDIFLAGVIVFTHGVYVRRAGEWLDKQR